MIANLTIDYETPAGKITKHLTVLANIRHTVLVFSDNGEGIGPGYAVLGIVVSSDQPVMVEKPTYSASPPSYGATDTMGYSPAGGF